VNARYCRYYTDAFMFYNFTSLEELEEDPTTQVMLKSIQDPELAPIYVGLPDLGYVLYPFKFSSHLYFPCLMVS
jgi:hypothetical protein